MDLTQIRRARCGVDASGSVAGCCEHGNEPSAFVKCGRFFG